MAKLEPDVTENLTDQDRDEIDDDNDELHALHKITPAVYKPTVSEINKQDTSKTGINQSNFDAQSLVNNDLKKSINTSIPKDYPNFVQCHIKREKEGIIKGYTTTYTLYLDGQDGSDKNVFLTARKYLTIGGHSEYFIGTDTENPSRNLTEEHSIANLKGTNIAGSEFILYDQKSSNNDKNKQQLAAIIYETHMFGSKEPRKLTVLLHDSETTNQQLKEGVTITDEWRAGRLAGLTEFKNKSPVYDEETKKYVLSLYENRVKQPSHKNFQLVASNDENYVCMQFGRIDDNNFALDYRYPLTTNQAFAIALSSFHNRFRT